MKFKKEYEEFWEMTKPIKFRKLRLFKNYIVDWCGVIRERIKYLYYNILYKLKIVKRYSYRDTTERILPLPHHIENPTIITSRVKAVMESCLREFKSVDLDYFYTDAKDGSRKIKFTVRDYTNTGVFLVSSLKDIYIKIDKWYSIDKSPTLKVSCRNKYTEFIKKEDGYIDSKINTFRDRQYKTYHLDTFKLRSLSYKVQYFDIGIDFSEKVLKHFIESSKNKFENYLEELTLQDLVREE